MFGSNGNFGHVNGRQCQDSTEKEHFCILGMSLASIHLPCGSFAGLSMCLGELSVSRICRPMFVQWIMRSDWDACFILNIQ